MEDTQPSASEVAFWVECLGRRIDRAIAELDSEERENMELRGIRRDARIRVREELGLEALEGELSAIGSARHELNRRENEALRGALSRLRGVSPGDVEDAALGYRAQKEIAAATTRRLAEAEEELLRGAAIGRLLLELKAERATLSDAVPMALAPEEVRRLWAAISNYVSIPLRRVERLALGLDEGPRGTTIG